MDLSALKFVPLDETTIKNLTDKCAAMADASDTIASEYVKVFGGRNRVGVADTLEFLARRSAEYRAASSAAYWSAPAEVTGQTATDALNAYRAANPVPETAAQADSAEVPTPEPTETPEPDAPRGRRGRA